MKKITQRLNNNQNRLVLGGGLVAVGDAAFAAVPTEVTTVFTTLGTDVGTLLAAAAVLFGLIRGGTAILKISSRFFGAAGA